MSEYGTYNTVNARFWLWLAGSFKIVVASSPGSGVGVLSLMRNNPPVETYHRPMPRLLWWS